VQKPVDGNVIGKLGHGGQIVTLPAGNNQPNPQNGTPSQNPGKIVTLPAPTNTTNGKVGIGKIVTLPATNNPQNGGNAGTTNGSPPKIVSMPVNAGTKIDVKPVNVQTQNQPIRLNNGNTGIVKPNNVPVNKVQVQTNVQTNRPQLNTMPNRMVSSNNNLRQSMNQAPSMSNGGDHRGGFMH
jgi:hypothetical protein